MRANNIARREPRKSLRPQTGSVAPGSTAPLIDAVVLHRTGKAEIGGSLSELDAVMERTVQRFQQRYMAASRNIQMKPGKINRATSEMIFAVRYARTRVP